MNLQNIKLEEINPLITEKWVQLGLLSSIATINVNNDSVNLKLIFQGSINRDKTALILDKVCESLNEDDEEFFSGKLDINSKDIAGKLISEFCDNYLNLIK